MARPRKHPDERYATPNRQLARVNDADWEILKLAAKAQNKTFSDWAIGILLPRAKRELSKLEARV